MENMKPLITFLRNGSGIIKEKLKEVFGNRLPRKDLNLLATIIYYPEEKLNLIRKEYDVCDYKEFQKNYASSIIRSNTSSSQEVYQIESKKNFAKRFQVYY